jgi:hypothetical protein
MSHSTSHTGVQYVGLSDTESPETTVSADEAAGEERTKSKTASTRVVNQNIATGSNWSVGWKTPLIMWSFYMGGNLVIYRQHPSPEPRGYGAH